MKICLDTPLQLWDYTSFEKEQSIADFYIFKTFPTIFLYKDTPHEF